MKKLPNLTILSLLSGILVACVLLATPVPAVPLPTALPVSPTDTASPVPTQTALPGPAVVLTQVHMLDEAQGWGWVMNTDGTNQLLHTSNGGNLWADVSPLSQSISPYSSFFLDVQTAWLAVFDPATNTTTLLRTTDSGKSWASLPQSEVQKATYQFTSANDGIAETAGLGAGNMYLNFYETHDGGANWTPIILNPPNPDEGLQPGTVHLCNICEDMLYYDASHVIIGYGDMGSMTPGGMVHLTFSNDLGKTWNKLNLALPSDQYKDFLIAPRSPVFFGPQTGFLPVLMSKQNSEGTFTSSLAVYTTKDGGVSWKAAPASLDNVAAFATIDFVTSMDAFVACGLNLCATHDGAQTWQAMKSGLIFDINAASGDHVSQFDFASAQTGWAVLSNPDGNVTSLWKTTDGGSTWTKLAPTLAP